MASTGKLAPRNLLPLRQSSSPKCFPASHMVSRYPAPSPQSAIIIPRVSSAPWIPQSRESHESICHHLPPWELRRAESQASRQNTSVSPCSSPALLVNLWKSPAGKSAKNAAITSLSLLPTPTALPITIHIFFIIPDLAQRSPHPGSLPNSQVHPVPPLYLLDQTTMAALNGAVLKM